LSEPKPAWVIGHLSVKDPARWDSYRRAVPATLGPFGGKVLLRGKVTAVLSGDHRHTDSVVLVFPNEEAARGWHDSAAYRALIPLRNEAADIDLFMVAG
jgi:uncharacterized protein (DUF1330 family)